MLILNGIVLIRTIWLNWITWNINVFDDKTVYLHLNCVLTLHTQNQINTIRDALEDRQSYSMADSKQSEQKEECRER